MDLANRVPTGLALDLLDPRDGERVLDAGCGTGAAIAALLGRADCRCMGVDASPTMVEAARRRLPRDVELACCKVEDLDPCVGPFDAVLALNVLYFAAEDGAMMRRLHDLLRPGGRLVAYVTDAGTMARWRFARAGRHRLFDLPALGCLLEQGGFAPGAISLHALPIAPGVTGLIALARRD